MTHRSKFPAASVSKTGFLNAGSNPAENRYMIVDMAFLDSLIKGTFGVVAAEREQQMKLIKRLPRIIMLYIRKFICNHRNASWQYATFWCTDLKLLSINRGCILLTHRPASISQSVWALAPHGPPLIRQASSFWNFATVSGASVILATASPSLSIYSTPSINHQPKSKATFLLST